MRTMLVMLLWLAACGGGRAEPPANPAAPSRGEAPARRLTRDECEAAVDHAIALFEADAAMASAAEMMRGGRDTYVAQCEATASVADRDCLMKATTAEQLGLCPMPGAP